MENLCPRMSCTQRPLHPFSVYLSFQVFIENEPSIDLAIDDTSSSVIHFDALQLKRQQKLSKRSDSHLDVDRILRTVEVLKRNARLTVFGVDIVIDAITQRHLLIDINHFPSMKRISRSIEAFHETLYICLSNRKQQQTSTRLNFVSA